MASSIKFGTKFLAAALCTASFSFLSCSDSGDGGGGGSSAKEVYKVKEITDSYFEVVETETYYVCTETGLKQETEDYTDRIYYSIDNKVLTLGFWNDALKFTGNSNTIIGTWTRNKNVSQSCKDQYNYDEYEGYYCDYNYDIVRLKVSETQAEITRDVCEADNVRNGDERRGWTVKVINCNTFEVSKGSDKLRISENRSKSNYTFKITYNGKTCTMTERSSLAESTSACNKARTDCQASEDDYYCIKDTYYDYLRDFYRSFWKCVTENNFPMDFFEGDSDDSDDDGEFYGPLAKKALLKPKR